MLIHKKKRKLTEDAPEKPRHCNYKTKTFKQLSLKCSNRSNKSCKYIKKTRKMVSQQIEKTNKDKLF